jgi:hypothetical protein
MASDPSAPGETQSPDPAAVRTGWERALEWLLLCLFSLSLIGSGVAIIVTGRARPFRGQGPVALDPASAWVTGLAVIAAGPLLIFLFAMARGRSAASAPRKRWITLLDMVFLLFLFVMLGLCLLAPLVSSLAERGMVTLILVAAAATVFALYKLFRIHLEFRAGISVSTGWYAREGPDYAREKEPVSYWWAIGHESLYFLLAAAVAIGLWALAWHGLT